MLNNKRTFQRYDHGNWVPVEFQDIEFNDIISCISDPVMTTNTLDNSIFYELPVFKVVSISYREPKMTVEKLEVELITKDFNQLE